MSMTTTNDFVMDAVLRGGECQLGVPARADIARVSTSINRAPVNATGSWVF